MESVKQDFEKQPVAEAVRKALQEQQPEAPVADTATMIRQAMAKNFIQHCVNAAATDGAEHPVMSGTMAAVTELLVAVLNQDGDAQIGRNIDLVANALVNIGFGQDANLAEQLMGTWAVAAGRNGKFNALIGKLTDATEVDYRTFVMNRIDAAQKDEVPMPVVGDPVAAAPAPEVIDQPEQEVMPVAESLHAEAEQDVVQLDETPVVTCDPA